MILICLQFLEAHKELVAIREKFAVGLESPITLAKQKKIQELMDEIAELNRNINKERNVVLSQAETDLHAHNMKVKQLARSKVTSFYKYIYFLLI
jgi:hypothetical protein